MLPAQVGLGNEWIEAQFSESFPKQIIDMAMTPARITLLDMGDQKYGDSILCQFGSKTILIDGGHLFDDAPRDGHPSLPEQLEAITGSWPLRVDLLIVTHCHADHIGCLPQLIGSGDLTAEWALVADPQLGWGKIGDINGGDAPSAWDAASPDLMEHAIVTALFDDRPLDGLSQEELRTVLEDGVKLWDGYNGMLDKLAEDGTKLVRYGVDSTTKLVAAFADCKMKILGPTKAHLMTCARYLAGIGRDALEVVNSQMDAIGEPETVLRTLVDQGQFATDMAGPGAALNDQSIVLRFEINGRKLLLAGDMQFAEAQVPGLDEAMTKLRQTVKNDGPYFFAKTCHHTSYNGLDETILEEWGPDTLLAHSGGLKDPGHPDPGALKDLRQLARAGAFARTDRNGQISVDLTLADPTLEVERGEIDDFRVNPKPRPRRDDEQAVIIAPVQQPEAVIVAPIPPVAATSRSLSDGMVEVVTRVPHVATRVTVAITVEPGTEAGEKVEEGSGAKKNALAGNQPPTDPERDPEPDPGGPLKLGGGRKMPRLLFLTSDKALAKKIGQTLVDDTVRAVKAAGSEIIADLPENVTVVQAAARVKSKLQEDSSFEGLVILGGYDVVPSARLDTLTKNLRNAVQAALPDPDNFIVWSDAILGDLDGDTFAELPISRIPDAGSPALFKAAFEARDKPIARKFCVHNVKRPFAKHVFKTIPGQGKALISEPTRTADSRLVRDQMEGHLYLMLHGSDADGSAFWGEQGGMMLEAFDVSCIPSSGDGIVFTGACWGALTATRKAAAQDPSQAPKSKAIDQSIPLTLLKAGYRGFVGCTGSHYSPLGLQPDSAGGPMHAHFWKEIVAGAGPALALFKAKSQYAKGVPNNQDPVAEAIAQKIVRQFTCLGLGW